MVCTSSSRCTAGSRSACRSTSRACSTASTGSGSPIRTPRRSGHRSSARSSRGSRSTTRASTSRSRAASRSATTRFRQDVPATVFMMSNPLATPSAEQVERGVAVVTAEDNRWQRCDLKTISLVGNVLMRQLAADADAVETVMFRDGHLTEASASNVLVVIGGAIVAPPKDQLILPGITYGATFDFAREAAIPFEIRPVGEGRGARRRRDVAHVVDEGSAGGDHVGREALRGRQAGAAVPEDARALPGAEAEVGSASRRGRRRRSGARSAFSRAGAWCRSGRDGTRAPLPCCRPQVSTIADEQHMIAGAMPRVVAALEPRDAARDQRDAGTAQPIVDALEAICVRPRKPAREIDLVVREHVDRVVLGPLEGREVLRAPVEAPHDERRVERHRVERVRGEADEPVVRSGAQMIVTPVANCASASRNSRSVKADTGAGATEARGAVGGGGASMVAVCAGGKAPMVAAAARRRPA